jgi:hypothetical protein
LTIENIAPWDNMKRLPTESLFTSSLFHASRDHSVHCALFTVRSREIPPFSVYIAFIPKGMSFLFSVRKRHFGEQIVQFRSTGIAATAEASMPTCVVRDLVRDVGLWGRLCLASQAVLTPREETHGSEILPARQAMNVPAGLARIRANAL